MDYKLFNDSQDKKSCLLTVEKAISAFLSEPNSDSFNHAMITIASFNLLDEALKIGLSTDERLWVEDNTSFLFLFYKDKLSKDSINSSMIKFCLDNLIRQDRIYDCYELVSNFGVFPRYAIATDYYNQIKKIEFIRLCLKKWENRFSDNPRKIKGKEAILKYYLGGVVSSFISFDRDLDNGDNMLTAQEQYYYCLTSKILNIDFEQISSDAINSITANDIISLYYKGLICLLMNDQSKAREYFSSSTDFKYSKYLLANDISIISQPYNRIINPTIDDYSIFDDYFHYFECYISLNNIHCKPSLYNAFKGNFDEVEKQIKEDEAFLLSQFLYKDLYDREISLSEEEYNKRIAYFNQQLINVDGNGRALFFDTEKGIERLGDESAENQIALTIKMFKYKDCKFYANLIYYYYFRGIIDQEAVINLSMYVIYVAKKELGKELLKIGVGTGLSLMALKMLTPFYDYSTPVRQLFAAIPLAAIKASNILEKTKSEYEVFKKEVKGKMYDLKMHLGEKEFGIKYRFMTIIDKMKQIDNYINSGEFDNPSEGIDQIFDDEEDSN